jgi:hypothetical protein
MRLWPFGSKPETVDVVTRVVTAPALDHVSVRGRLTVHLASPLTEEAASPIAQRCVALAEARIREAVSAESLLGTEGLFGAAVLEHLPPQLGVRRVQVASLHLVHATASSLPPSPGRSAPPPPMQGGQAQSPYQPSPTPPPVTSLGSPPREFSFGAPAALDAERAPGSSAPPRPTSRPPTASSEPAKSPPWSPPRSPAPPLPEVEASPSFGPTLVTVPESRRSPTPLATVAIYPASPAPPTPAELDRAQDERALLVPPPPSVPTGIDAAVSLTPRPGPLGLPKRRATSARLRAITSAVLISHGAGAEEIGLAIVPVVRDASARILVGVLRFYDLLAIRGVPIDDVTSEMLASMTPVQDTPTGRYEESRARELSRWAETLGGDALGALHHEARVVVLFLLYDAMIAQGVQQPLVLATLEAGGTVLAYDGRSPSADLARYLHPVEPTVTGELVAVVLRVLGLPGEGPRGLERALQPLVASVQDDLRLTASVVEMSQRP